MPRCLRWFWPCDYALAGQLSTVLGATTNLRGARLDPLNQEDGTHSLVSEAIAKRASGGFAVMLKGSRSPWGVRATQSVAKEESA